VECSPEHRTEERARCWILDEGGDVCSWIPQRQKKPLGWDGGGYVMYLVAGRDQSAVWGEGSLEAALNHLRNQCSINNKIVEAQAG
jgi:hypothetical protein